MASCPTCKREVEWSPAAPWRPFCSERCKLIDLGAWASEKHVIGSDHDEASEFDDSDAPSESNL